MNRLARLLPCTVMLACVSRPTTAPRPAAAMIQVPRATDGDSAIATAVRRALPVDTLASSQVPPFHPGPLIAWGPLPPGEVRPERIRSFDLQHQIVHVRFDWPRHAVVGSTTLRLAALDQPLATITLDAAGMRILGVSGAGGRPLRYDYDGRALRVQLPMMLAVRARTSLTVEYESVRPRKGAYFVDRRHIVWTQGETEDTRYWVPTFDDPSDKTTWEFFIRVPRSEKALSNGRLAGSRAVGGEVEWHWVQNRPASTYLMTAAAGDFVVLQDKWKTVPVGYWTYPDSVDAAWRGFGKTPRAIEFFSARTGVPYPWAKYDQVVAPDYIFGGMENVTATTQADDDILHPAWAEPEANADDLVSHELGHQWYGDLLTARRWADVWLNEGFATFLQQSFREADKGTDEGSLTRLEAQEETIAADRRARRPIVFGRWMVDPLEVFLSGHIYPKGALVLQMLRHQLGDSLFWRAMNRYTTSHLYGSVVTDDLRDAFERSTGRDYRPFFDQWVYGAGFPVFQVTYAYDSAAKRLRLAARQVQPRDSLTGFFDADVDVEILTDGAPIRVVMPVHGETSELVVDVPSPPRSIRWDKGNWLLDIADFPRPTTMLAWQLAHDDDALGRIEAVELLAERTGDLVAARALAGAARGDAFWSVRARAIAALGVVARANDGPAAPATPLGTVAAAAALASSRDRDPRVREAAPPVLGAFDRESFLAEAPRLLADSSRYVRGAALKAMAAVAPASAMTAIRDVLQRDSWLDIERTQAVGALAAIDTPESWTLTLRYLAAGVARRTRQAAIASLESRAAGRERELSAALVPLLDADDFYVRQDAAAALGRLGQASSVSPLEARRQVEAESRVINAIDAALTALRPR